MKSSLHCSGFIGMLLALTLGCGGERTPPLAPVEGVLMLTDGTPLGKVRVSFLPDPEAEIFGRPSEGVTDDAGRFVLTYTGPQGQPGAVVGSNRAMLTDLLAIETSRDENPIPRRFATKYIESATTDLHFEVKRGELNSFEIRIEPSPQ